MRTPAARKKMKAAMQRIGKRPLWRGGNGMPMAIPQRTLLAALGNGWYAEHVVLTKTLRQSSLPHCYKIDIAHPHLMLAIEVDGNSHLARKKLDQKRDRALTALGWKVLRFRNKEVLTNLQEVLQSITSLLPDTQATSSRIA